MTVKDFFYDKTWEELNKPFQKHHVVNAFEEFKMFKFKKHINLQLGAGVDKLFETLIDDKFINRFLKAWSLSFPIAITAILIVAPVTRKFVDKITKSS